MAQPKMSVIIPNYNHAGFLRQRIESVFSQTLQAYEVILLDDCSTDNSKTILQSYASHPLVSHLVINEINTGNPFRQWEKGVQMASGVWLWIAESDDYSDFRFLETLTKAIDAHPTAGLVYCDSYIVKGDQVQGGTFAAL